MKFSSLAALEFVKMTLSIAASDENVVSHVVICMKFSSLAALEFVKMTLSIAASDENVVSQGPMT